MNKLPKYEWQFANVHQLLQRQVNSALFERINNNKTILSAVLRDLHTKAEKSLRDRYVPEFLSLPKHHSENEFRKAIIKNLKDFVLEFGKDFALVGEEYRLQVGQKDYYTDLLFYHRELKCLVAFDLKINGFFDDDGNPIDPFAEPKLCLYLICKEKDNDDPGENMLCAMNRWDQREEAEFNCGGFKNIKNN